jgi:hypothetical protein
VSLPEHLVRRLKRLSQATGLKVSRIVAQAIEQQLVQEAQSSQKSPVYPTALWKLKGRRSLSGPSPRLMRKRVGSWRTVDLDSLQV